MFLLKVNFDKSTIRINHHLISFMLTKFVENYRSIAMSLINSLNCKFL